MDLVSNSEQPTHGGLGAFASSMVGGYVPSLEALPFMEWAERVGLRIQARPGYGNIVRGLLTGSVDVALIPWELFVSELLSRKGQSRAWKIPAVFRAFPMELAFSHAARNRMSSRKRSKATGSQGLVFGVEAKHSFTKRQIVAWLEAASPEMPAEPRFAVLPMKLMMKALRMGEVDGIVAPSPWGLQAEVERIGSVDTSFDEGVHAQSLVMVSSERLARSFPHFFETPLAEVFRADALERNSAAFRKWTASLSSSRACPLSEDLFRMAMERYKLEGRPGNFVPDAAWIENELKTLVGRKVISMEEGSISGIARYLTM